MQMLQPSLNWRHVGSSRICWVRLCPALAGGRSIKMAARTTILRSSNPPELHFPRFDEIGYRLLWRAGNFLQITSQGRRPCAERILWRRRPIIHRPWSGASGATDGRGTMYFSESGTITATMAVEELDNPGRSDPRAALFCAVSTLAEVIMGWSLTLVPTAAAARPSRLRNVVGAAASVATRVVSAARQPEGGKSYQTHS